MHLKCSCASRKPKRSFCVKRGVLTMIGTLLTRMVVECEAVDLQRSSSEKPVVSESETVSLWLLW
jgi:hypothetical protein